MNKLRLIFIITIIFISSCNKPSLTSKLVPPPSDLTITTAANHFINSQIVLINKKYNMICSGTGTSLYDGVKKLTWYFRTPKQLTRDEGRIIILDCVNQIVKNANNNEELQAFFNSEGFTQKNVNISILVVPKDFSVYHPEICAFGFDDNELDFHTKDSQKQYGYHTSEYESYEEAVAILKTQGKEDILLGSEFTLVNHECK